MREKREATGSLSGAADSVEFLSQAAFRVESNAEAGLYGLKARTENARAQLLREAEVAARPVAAQGGPWELSFLPEAGDQTWPLALDFLTKGLAEHGGFRAEAAA